MNVLSLFDGMSCGQLALNRAGIAYDTYYASEIDKHAIKVTQANYPNTVQLGDITKIRGGDLPKIDLLIGGSPCQGFSFAGKQLNFDDPRSKLFFEYARLLKETQPSYFLLENVRMKRESQDVISAALGVEPIMIDSALVSAQSRKRLYWTNIPNVKQPNNQFLTIKNILENTVPVEYYATHNYKRKLKDGRYAINVLVDNYTPTKIKYSCKPIRVSNIANEAPSGRARDMDGLWSIHGTMKTVASFPMYRFCKIDNGTDDYTQWRTLTPTECERLQTVPDNYTAHVSNSQRYKMLGNGWTVDVIAHILRHIPR